MGSNGIGVIPGPRTSFLDHLVPLCHLMEVPLHCADPWVATCAHIFYPPIEILSGDLTTFDTFYVVEPCRLHGRSIQFEQFLHTGDFKTVAGFHGNPDKFRETFWIERYVDEDVVLVYGDQLIDFLKEKGVWTRLKKAVRIGNLRYAFYRQHKAFFDRVAEPHLIAHKKKRTVLWAPTWSYTRTADDSPFFEVCTQVFSVIPEDTQLIVKLHPYMFRLFPEQVSELRERYEEVHFIDEVPLVYPFLDKVDIYVGDYSSVSYDFLVFDKPLFFIGEKKVPWGITVEDPRRLFHEIDRPDHLSAERKAAYAYAYGEDVPLEEIKKQLA